MYDEDADPVLESNLEVGKEKEEVETKKSRSARTKMRKMFGQGWRIHSGTRSTAKRAASISCAR